MRKLFNLFVEDGDEQIQLRPDKDRSHEDLVFDVKQKRKLNNKLLRANKRLKHMFAFGSTFLVVSLVSVFIYINHPSIKKTYNYHFSSFMHRYISNNGLILTTPTDFKKISNIVEDKHLIFESNMLNAIMAMNEKEFTKAITILDNIDTDEAKWLKALCFLRLNKKIQLKASLDELVSTNSLFTLEAKEIINQYYRNQTN
jgi:hypothetical protein